MSGDLHAALTALCEDGDHNVMRDLSGVVGTDEVRAILDAYPPEHARNATRCSPGCDISVGPGLYSDVTLADWDAWARDRDEWDLPPGAEGIDERTVEFAVALANTFGPTDDTRADSHVEVVSWFMADAIECVEHLPDGPIQVTKIDATHGNYTFVIVVNGFVFVLPDGEGDVYIEPLCLLPAMVTEEQVEAAAEVMARATGEPRVGRFERTMTVAVLRAAGLTVEDAHDAAL